MRSLYEGTGVALVTPFKNNQIDFLALKKLINRDISMGAQAIVVLATTGEGTTVSTNERYDIIKFAKDVIDNRCKLIVGTGNNNFSTCLEYTQMAKNLGADGALVVTPYYNKTTQAGLVKYYQELARLEFPMIMYNVPSRTGLNLELETIEQIVKTNPFVYGIKESTTDISRICRLCEICKDKIPIYSGEDALNYVFYCLGGNGCISVTANVACDQVQKIFSLVKNKDSDSALSLQRKLAPVDKVLFCETNPIPVKHMLSLMGLCSNEVRMPLIEPSNTNKQKIRAVYAQHIEKPKDL